MTENGSSNGCTAQCLAIVNPSPIHVLRHFVIKDAAHDIARAVRYVGAADLFEEIDLEKREHIFMQILSYHFPVNNRVFHTTVQQLHIFNR